jgi:glucose-6-phosphate dehydrogenase assembly protein OpcA
VSEDIWSGEDTTPDAIDAALRGLLRDRHAADRAVAPARVLNLIVVVDHARRDEVSDRLRNVGRYHASRTILCAVEEGRTSLNAVATMAYEEGEGGGVHPVRERVDLELGPSHLRRLDSIIDPILVEGLSTMLWSPDGHDEAVQALLSMIDVILLDSDDPDSGGLARAAELRRSAYVVDLAWLRTTPWRERLAASFDLPQRRSGLARMTDACVRHRPSSPASAVLLAGWLAARLDWQVAPLGGNGDVRRGKVRAAEGGGEIEIALAPQEQEPPGLVGVTVGWEGGCSLSLDRGQGGLTAHQRDAQGEERSWRVLGASRGEGLILGEGVRQALLRDPTYGPALEAALQLSGASAR